MAGKEPFRSLPFLEDLIVRLEADQGRPFDPRQAAAGLRQLLEEFRQARDFDFREIGDHLYDGIYIADGAGKTLYVNKAYARITGIRPEEIVGRYVKDIEDEGLYKNAVTPMVIKDKKQVNAMGESSRNGIKMLITGNPIFDEAGNVKKVVVIDREITDLLGMKAELEASQQKMQAVEQDKNKNKLEIEHLRRLHLSKNLIGNSPEIQQIVKMIQQVADLDITVLITGETGSGKEVVANEIYTNSSRNSGPFIKVNCAAIPTTLLEAELFGYEKGAYTGAASTGKLGMFELADKGTLLLDEIGEMPLELQSKLLRVIQHKEIIRVGGRKPIKLDVRILSSTNCDLRELVRQGRFREDLFYRLNVFPIHIPPLRLRATDIEVLTKYFLAAYNTKYGKQTRIESPGVEILKRYLWPGNIRELQNIIERLVIVAEQSTVISAEQIGNLLNIDPYYTELLNQELGLKEIVENIEKKTIEKVLALCGSTRKAAKILRIDQSTVVKKAKKLGIVVGDEKRHQ
ncbi:MAG: sigma 54-interacting transcriptional regulator [Negativicutes bacterium]|nr:sigma 54-interacting transcriptional regulator [Negativicutes bacterium]